MLFNTQTELSLVEKNPEDYSHQEACDIFYNQYTSLSEIKHIPRWLQEELTLRLEFVTSTNYKNLKPLSMSFVHGDVLPRNIICTHNADYLIDWERSHFGSPQLDALRNILFGSSELFSNNLFKEKIFLETYNNIFSLLMQEKSYQHNSDLFLHFLITLMCNISLPYRIFSLRLPLKTERIKEDSKIIQWFYKNLNTLKDLHNELYENRKN